MMPVFGQGTISVYDSACAAQAELQVYAFDGDIYQGFSRTIDTSGSARMILPEGDCCFRADQFNFQFFSGVSKCGKSTQKAVFETRILLSHRNPPACKSVAGESAL